MSYRRTGSKTVTMHFLPISFTNEFQVPVIEYLLPRALAIDRENDVLCTLLCTRSMHPVICTSHNKLYALICTLIRGFSEFSRKWKRADVQRGRMARANSVSYAFTSRPNQVELPVYSIEHFNSNQYWERHGHGRRGIEYLAVYARKSCGLG